MCKLLFLIAVSIHLFIPNFGSFPLPYVHPEQCNIDEYFDPICLKCKRCGTTKKDGQENLQQPTTDGLACICKPMYYLKERQGPYNILCAQCPKNKIPSADGLSCITCSETNPFNETIGACEPCQNGITVENGKERLCIPCGKETASEKRAASCKNCSGDLESVGETCSCHSNLTLSGGQCLPLVRSKPLSLFTVNFENGVSVRSAFFVEHFNAAYHNCEKHFNYTACQVLANMCSMLLYQLGNPVINADNACSMFMNLLKGQSFECDTSGQSFGFRKFYYTDAKNELYKTNVPNAFTSDPHLDSTKLKFISVKYDLNGVFRGMTQMRSPILQLCSSSYEIEDVSFVFGTAYQKKCKISVQDLWKSSNLFFEELYLLNDLNNNNSNIYPVHVLIKELRLNGELVNQEDDMSKWYLVRRFFLSDAVSGIEAGTSLFNKQGQPVSKVLRYVSDVTLKITLRTDGSPGMIFPPLLILSYKEVIPDDYLRNKKVPLSFSILYEMNQSASENGISIAVGILSAFSLLWSVMQTWSWFRRAGKQAVDVLTLGKFLVFVCGNLSTTFLVVVFCASLNWLFVFKMQDVVHLLLPTSHQERFLSTYLGIAFGMKFVRFRPFK